MGNTDLSPDSEFRSHGSVMTIKINEKILTATFIFLFFVVMFIILLIIYAKNNWIPRISAHAQTHFIIPTTDAPIPERGLGVDILRSLPVTEFRRIDFKDGVECSVCLCELSDGEKFRLLPKCKHGFHLDCIDMWLHSHITCPLCRCAVSPLGTAGGQMSLESPALPTNMLVDLLMGFRQRCRLWDRAGVLKRI